MSIDVQVAAANSRGLDAEDDLVWTWSRIGPVVADDLALTSVTKCAHRSDGHGGPSHGLPIAEATALLAQGHSMLRDCFDQRLDAAVGERTAAAAPRTLFPGTLAAHGRR